MKRQWLTIALAVGTIGWVGCGSSSSTQAPASMDQMATAVEQQSAAKTPAQNENQTTGLKTKAAADNAAPTEPAAKAVPVAAADPALRTKRGFDLEDWSNEAAYVLVKTDAAKTADALAQIWKGKVVRDMFGKPTDEKRNQVVVYQLAGHPWSVFACDGRQLETLVPSLSRDADVLVAWNSDFNGWSGIALYRGGQEVEAIHWGAETDKLGEDADVSKWQTSVQVPHKVYTDLYLFRSTLRKTTPQDLQKGDAFVDDLFRQQDAYLPDMDQMPWVDFDSHSITSPLGAAAFAGVHAVEVAGT